jgi:hypothetical protein
MASKDVAASVQEIEIGPHLGLPQLNNIKNSLDQVIPTAVHLPVVKKRPPET